MWIYLSARGEVNISMEKYLKKEIEKLPEYIKATNSTPSTKSMFKVQYYDMRKILHRKWKI